jgi:hypothetical protein
LEGAENFRSRGGLVAEPEDEDAGQDLFRREQAEATSLTPEFYLCSGRGGGGNRGQSLCKRGVASMIERCKPAVEELPRGCIGDEAHLLAPAREVNENGGVNRADVVPRAGGLRSVAGIAEDDGVDLVWIVIVFLVPS